MALSTSVAWVPVQRPALVTLAANEDNPEAKVASADAGQGVLNATTGERVEGKTGWSMAPVVLVDPVTPAPVLPIVTPLADAYARFWNWMMALMAAIARADRAAMAPVLVTRPAVMPSPAQNLRLAQNTANGVNSTGNTAVDADVQTALDRARTGSGVSVSPGATVNVFM